MVGPTCGSFPRTTEPNDGPRYYDDWHEQAVQRGMVLQCKGEPAKTVGVAAVGEQVNARSPEPCPNLLHHGQGTRDRPWTSGQNPCSPDWHGGLSETTGSPRPKATSSLLASTVEWSGLHPVCWCKPVQCSCRFSVTRFPVSRGQMLLVSWDPSGDWWTISVGSACATVPGKPLDEPWPWALAQLLHRLKEIHLYGLWQNGPEGVRAEHHTKILYSL